MKDANEFLKTELSYALVLRGELDSINEIKEYLSTIPDIRLIYQKWSFDPLYISPNAPSGSRE
jgi:hypothetical protein